MGRSQDYNRSRRPSPAPPSNPSPPTVKPVPVAQPPRSYVPEIVITGIESHRPDVIVYSLQGKEAYSSLGETYQDAIRLLYEAYPRELAEVSSGLVEFSLSAATGHSGSPRHVVISDSAWGSITTGLPRCTIIYVTVIAPPQYDESDSRELGEKNTLPTLSPASSRPGSPDGRSPSPPHGHQSSHRFVEKAKGILGFN